MPLLLNRSLPLCSITSKSLKLPWRSDAAPKLLLIAFSLQQCLYPFVTNSSQSFMWFNRKLTEGPVIGNILMLSEGRRGVDNVFMIKDGMHDFSSLFVDVLDA